MRLGLAISDLTERLFPDAFVFALVGIVVVFVAGLLLGRSPAQMTLYFGGGFWSLIPFTMQMALIVIFGYVVASSPPVYRLLQWLAPHSQNPPTPGARGGPFSAPPSPPPLGGCLLVLRRPRPRGVRRVPPPHYR